MTTYTVTTQESSSPNGGDLAILSQGGLQLQVAKSVTDTSGTTSLNVTANYALNWMTSIPNPGAKVEYEGNWKPCNPGDLYDLDNTGSWQTNQNNPNAEPNCLNVGNNGYEENVYIIVGVEVAPNSYSTIWVSPNELLMQNGGEYEPLETVTVWYEAGTQTASMVSTQQSNKQSTTLTPDENTVYFSYSTLKKGWLEPQTSPFTFSPS